MGSHKEALAATYADGVMDHFVNPRNVGEIDNPDGTGMSGDPSCGDAVRITVRIKEDRIDEIRFLTYGCPAAIAMASALTELARGRTLDAAVEISDTDVARALGGLPPQKLHCSAMAIDALRASVEDHVLRPVREARQQNGK